jgi:hypothetical protein
MEKTLQTLRFLSKGFARVTLVDFLCILATVATADLVYFLTDRANPIHPVVTLTMPFETTSGIIALIIGLALFISNFHVVLANGVSRKTFLLVNLPAAGLAAAALALFNLVVVLVHGLFWPIILTSGFFYPQAGVIELFLLQLALYFLLIVAGWFIALAYYRSSVPVRWAISLSPAVGFALLEVLNAQTRGETFFAIDRSLQAVTATPISATLSWLALAAVLFGAVFLLIRRAPVRLA